MQRQRILDCVLTPDGQELVLYQRGDTFLIEVGGEDLMWSRAHGSEEDLARLALEALGHRRAPRVLVGGLGMGFTLRAALDALGGRPGATVVVAEVFPAVVDWNRRWLGHLAGQPLTDHRVLIQPGDVRERASEGAGAYDVILLDVDNGPQAMTLESNRDLYTDRGLDRLCQALTPGGVLAVWSATDDPRFAHRLARCGFASVATHRVRARASGKGGRHVVFVARRR
jgi:spermidine synthase